MFPLPFFCLFDGGCWRQSCCVSQAGLELVAVHLPLPWKLLQAGSTVLSSLVFFTCVLNQFILVLGVMIRKYSGEGGHTPGSGKPHATRGNWFWCVHQLIGNSAASSCFRAVFSLMFNTGWSWRFLLPLWPGCFLVLVFWRPCIQQTGIPCFPPIS